MGPGLFLPIFFGEFFQKGSKSSQVNTTNTHFSKNFPHFLSKRGQNFSKEKH
jgi:hypothetical protein